MKISAVETAKNSPSIQFKQSNNNEFCIIDSIYKNEKLLKTGLVGLAVIGAAAVSYSSIKHSGKNPVKIVKNNFKKIKKFIFQDKNSDPIIQKLGGKRDEDTLKLYKALIAKKKMESFHNKLLSGHFDGKPKEVFDSLRKNELKLRREASVVL